MPVLVRTRRIASIAALATLVCAGNAHAIPFPFTLDVANSSVTLTDQAGGGLACRLSSCGLEVALADSLGGSFSLAPGEDETFDFLEFTADGTTGFSGRRFDITATLAFTEPEGIDTTSTGQGRGFFVFGVITGGVLTWNDVPQSFTSSYGEVEVDFEDGVTILPLSTSVLTSASVSLGDGPVGAVPEPSGLLLFAVGMFGVGATRSRRVKSR